ncbi:Extracellular_nuclease [Hexamita inflata]|uniref:Extracellular nuclease n=1 Tax=Hexamita inflata TaxID=28002 RepID=A0AA86NW87_9EUKA|nr:Extracellular nuclease [Hexamita inflata]
MLLSCLVLNEYFPGLFGEQLRDELYYTCQRGQKSLGYDGARSAMYSYIYNDPKNNTVECLYTGIPIKCRYGSNDATCNPDLNCEHTVPQSFFNKAAPMKSDLHHLRPTWKKANEGRSNFPFSNIMEEKVDKYYGIDYQVSTTTPSDPQNWSKLDDNVAYEVREIQKGDTARALAYFFVRYPTQAGPITRTISDVNNLIQWDIEHPPTELQRQQYLRVVEKQGNINPFYEEVGLVARAYCDLSTKYPCSLYQ